MAKNKIGIEVQVNFPPIKELQAELARKWASVKNSFEGKINVGVDGNSLRQLKGKIERVLDNEVFEIKVKADVTEARKNINKFYNEIEKLDDKLNKHRELKIDIKGIDFDKPFRDILKDVEKVDKVLSGQTKELKSQTSELDKQAGKMSKIERIQKTLKDGTIAVTNKTTEKGSGGYQQTVTVKPDGKVDVKTIQDREKALNEMQKLMKDMQKLDLEAVDADKKRLDIINKRRDDLQSELQVLAEQYQSKYKMSVLESKEITSLAKQMDYELETKKHIKEQESLKKSMTEEEKKVASAVSEVARLEKLKGTLAKSAVNASKEESQQIKNQIQYYNKKQKSIAESNNLEKKMTDTQKDELQNIKNINSLEVKKLKAKRDQKAEAQRLSQEEKERASREKEALNDMLSDLRKVHKLELEIASIKDKAMIAQRDLNQQESFQVQKLETKLKHAKDIQKETSDYHRKQGSVTDEIEEQLRLEKEVYNTEKQRVREIAQVEAKQEGVAKALQQVKKYTDDISRLQRDLIYAGMREQNVIESAIDSLVKKREAVIKGLDAEKKVTKELRNQISQIEKQQSEQRELNRLRQDSREKDQAYNDTGGIIDPRQTFMYAEQGARAIFESVSRLDGALIGVKKVADATEEQFASFAESSYDVGSSLGVTSDEYILAVEKWVTAGKSFVESQALAKDSMIGAFVGNIAPDDMVKYMSVPMVAFEKAGLKSADVINVMNETANNHAIEMDELGKAYMRSATTAKDAGVSFEELTGMITGAQEATRKGGERIGTGIKSMALNAQNIFSRETGVQERKFDWFKNIGVSFEDANGEMKSMTKILDEVADKWDTLSDAEKGTAKFYLAGKEHAETMGAILDQWDTSVASTIEDASGEIGVGETGSAYVEHAKQADSIKFKVAELKNAWDKLMLTIAGGEDGVVKVLDSMVKGLDILNKLASNEKLMNTLKWIFVGIGLKAGVNAYKRFFDMMKTGLKNYKRDLEAIIPLQKWLGKLNGTTPKVNGGTGSGNGTILISGNGSKKDSDDSSSSKKKKTVTSKGGTTYVGTIGTAKKKTVKKKTDTDVDTDSKSKSSGKADVNVSKGAKALKLGGKFLSLIPFLGDALILLEIAGVDVFGKLGEGMDNLVTTTKEAQKELEQQEKSNFAKNGILNGSVEANEKKQDKVEETLKDGGVKIGKDYKLSGALDRDQFLAFQEEYNKLAEELGMVDENGVLITVDMNNTEHIEERLKKLNEYLLEVKKNELIDLGGEINSTVETANEAKQEWGVQTEFLKKYKEEYEDLKKKEQKLVEKQNSGVKLSFGEEQDLNLYRTQMSGLEKDIEITTKRIEEQKGILETATDSIGAYTQKLIEHVNKGGNFEGMDKEAVKASLGEMTHSYNQLVDDIDLATMAQEKLAKGAKFTDEEFLALQKRFPELSAESVDLANTNDEVRDRVKGVVDAEKEKAKKSQEATMTAINGAAGYVGAQLEMDEATGKVKAKVEKTGEEIENMYDKADKPPSPTISIGVKIKQAAKNLWDKIWSLGDKSVTVNAKAVESHVSVGGNGSTSESVSSIGGRLLSEPTTVASVDEAKSTTKASTTKKEVNNSRVSSDVWRYWKSEMNIDKVQDSISNLDRSISNASEKYDTMIKLIKQQNTLINKEISYQKTLKSQKQSEMNSTLKSLKKYGFKVSGNNITNLGQAKNLKGENAEKAEELLNTWKSLTSDLSSINKSIGDLTQQLKENNEQIKEAQIANELKKLEKTFKKVNALIKKVNNKDSITDQRLGLLNDADKELGLIENERAMLGAKQNMKDLITQFNSLSKTTAKYAENGEEMQSYLENLASEILSQADAIIEYQNAINQLEFDRVVSDLDKFNSAVESTNDRIDNTINNLKEGLLSGTSLKDLKSATGFKLNLNRDNEYEKLANERINLEKEVQEALDAFAKKNVDRTGKVSNAQLDIEAKKYNQMLKMQKDYTAGRKATYNKIKAEFDNLVTIGAKDEDYKFVDKIDDSYEKLVAKQNALSKKYEENIKKAKTQEEAERASNQYIIDSLKLQEEYYKSTITGYNNAISELNKQLKDSTLDDDIASQIRDKIDEYESAIIDAQNSIKETIGERFEFEFSLLEEAMSVYDEYAEKIQYAQSVLDSIGGNNFDAQGALFQEMLKLEKDKNNELGKSLAQLKLQQSLYKEGSYEWNLINEQVKEYESLLRDSNLELLELNNNIMSNSFSGTMHNLEKKLFDGKTLDEFERYQDLWMDGLERELALEDTYQRLADLGTQMYDEKMALLSKQEKLSRFEMDYLNKQLDVLELQQKLENLNQERTVQTLKRNEDGTWDWTYVADSSEIESVKEELKDAQLELENAKKEGQKEYISGLNEILSNAEDGMYDNVDEFKDAIEDLSQAFESIVGDIPEIQKDYLDSLVEAFSKNKNDNKVIVDSVNTSQSVTKKTLESVSYDIVNKLDKVGNDIVNAINNALKLTSRSVTLSPTEKAIESKSISITLENLEFPNVKSADGLKDAILSLPQIALQKSKEKI